MCTCNVTHTHTHTHTHMLTCTRSHTHTQHIHTRSLTQTHTSHTRSKTKVYKGHNRPSFHVCHTMCTNASHVITSLWKAKSTTQQTVGMVYDRHTFQWWTYVGVEEGRRRGKWWGRGEEGHYLLNTCRRAT